VVHPSKLLQFGVALGCHWRWLAGDDSKEPPDPKYYDRDSIAYLCEERRKFLGLSQRDVAKLANVSNTTISNLERGRFSDALLRKVCDPLHCSYKWLTYTPRAWWHRPVRPEEFQAE
jgi:DNA-binding XRE family transcriptional regulator